MVPPFRSPKMSAINAAFATEEFPTHAKSLKNLLGTPIKTRATTSREAQECAFNTDMKRKRRASEDQGRLVEPIPPLALIDGAPTDQPPCHGVEIQTRICGEPVLFNWPNNKSRIHIDSKMPSMRLFKGLDACMPEVGAPPLVHEPPPPSSPPPPCRSDSKLLDPPPAPVRPRKFAVRGDLDAPLPVLDLGAVPSHSRRLLARWRRADEMMAESVACGV
mmetsp:Transcript_10717/g.15990  ORF Transcript_10717/g.15990 Transcript_10717/m.15990 type:complete len:219 (+) Transcript_10717:240-896(+)